MPLRGECPMATRFGRFVADENEDYATVGGSVLDGVIPNMVLTTVETSGTCTLLRRENPYCNPACDPGDTCDLDGECVPYPVSQDLGTVTMDGLLDAISMEPVTPGYTYFDSSLPNPPWTPGALVRLDTGSGAWDPVRLYGVAPETLVVTTPSLSITKGEDLVLGWGAPAAAARTEAWFQLNIDQHGNTPLFLTCAFPDTGTATVPGALVDALVDAGVTGFPNAQLARRTVDSVALGDGCMDLVLSASALPDVAVSGYYPCERDEDCPGELECDEEIQTCV